MITKFLLCKKIFCVMHYEIEIWLMVHSTVKFRQNELMNANELINQSLIGLTSISGEKVMKKL